MYLQLTVIGIVSYMIFLKIHYNNPLMFSKVEMYNWGNQFTIKNIGREIFFLLRHYPEVYIPTNSNIQLLYTSTIHYLNLIPILAPVVLVTWIWKSLGKAYAVFTLVYIFGVVSSQAGYVGDSLGR